MSSSQNPNNNIVITSTDNNHTLAFHKAVAGNINNHEHNSSLLSHYFNSNFTIPSSNSSKESTINININNATNSLIDTHQGLWDILPKMDNLFDILVVGCSTAVIFGGLIPYVPQYLKIKQSLNSDGFSTYVCLTLLIANILRIMFWFGHRFELPLLIQSFVMITGMLAMMEICVRVRDKTASFTISSIAGGAARSRRRFLTGKLINNSIGGGGGSINNESTPIYSVLSPSPSANNPIPGASANYFSSSCSYQHSRPDTLEYLPEHASSASTSQEQESYSASIRTIQPSQQSYSGTPTISNSRNLKWLNLRDFWEWDDILSYMKFLSLFTLIVSLLTYLLVDNYLYVESLGFIAVFTESMLGMPQLFKNYIKKSTRGMSVEMVAMWLSGDIFKTLYFILRHQPVQFYICSSIQVVVDILILLQVFWYRRPNVTYRKLPKST